MASLNFPEPLREVVTNEHVVGRGRIYTAPLDESSDADPLPPECPPDLRASLVNAMTAVEAGIVTPDQLAQRLWEIVRERVTCDG